MATTQISDVIVPEIFTGYAMQETMVKSVLIQSGAVAVSAELSADLNGGGSTFNRPFFNSVARGESNVSNDAEDDQYTGGSANSAPKKITAGAEIQVRQSRNESWSSADLTAALAGADPMAAIASDVGGYWAHDLEASFIATIGGIYADNAAAPVGTEHVTDDMTNDISALAYSAGVTDIGSGAFIDTTVTMGDAMGELALMMVHSIVYARLQKQNLITFVPSSDGKINIATYLGRPITMSDRMPSAAGVYETWLFGRASVQFGQGSPMVPTETKRNPDSGNGGGSEVLYNRTERIVHPVGYAYIGAATQGGPTNAVQANAGSWTRVFPERKQIKMARLITREF